MSRGVFRGRGRGSYRGSSGGGFRGSSIRRGRGGENGFSPRGGRVNKWNVYGDSPRGSDRFRSSSRMDDSGYHRFGLKRKFSEVSNNPEKRMRTESQASSMRRSQDEGSYRGRSEYRGYRGGGFGADKRGSFGSRLRDRQESDSYPFRKTVSSFRGRFISSRSIGRTRGGRISRGFRPDTSSLTSRKLAGLLSRTEEDLRRLRMSSTLKRIKDLEKQGKSEENIDWDTIEDDDDEVVEEEVETEVEESTEEETGEESPKKKRKTEDASEDKKKNESVEDGEEVEESPKKKVVKKVVKKKVVKKPVKKETPTKKKASKEKDEGENEENEADEEKTEKESEKKDGDTDEKSSDFKYECPRCQTTCLTERGYNKHLQGAKHKAAMQKLTVALRSKLTIMRIEQRSDQRLIDQRRSSRNLETIFCRICKLNFRCLASEHARSFRHLKMKKFLMPICRLCKVSCKSPMMYEHHVCDVAHLKKAAQREKERELYKDNFMVVDAVGSQDEESDKEGKDKSKADGEEKDEEGKKDGEKSPEKKKKNLEVEHGYEFCKQISVFFCDLCESYLPQACSAMEDTALSAHCRSRKHMDRFIQLKKYQRRSQWEKTEKLEEKKMEEKSKSSSGKEGKPAVNGVSADKSAKKKEKSDEKAPADDEKIWSALGDFLDQVEPSGKSSDDEEESGRRYDRFKDSELKDGAIEVEDE